MWITRVSVANPVFATMTMVALLVLGLFSYARLNIDQYPALDYPLVSVQTSYPGAAPETVEAEVTRPIEEQVNTVTGVKQVTSVSYEGGSRILVEFDLSASATRAAQDVRDKVALVRPGFRREVEEPVILHLNPEDQPIVSLTLTASARSLRELTTLADHVVRKRLEHVRGVGQATLLGGVKREIQILLQPARLQALGVAVDEVIEALARESQDFPVGAIRSARSDTLLTVRAGIADPREFEALIVAQRGSAPVRLRDVAQIVDGQEEREAAAVVDGLPALGLDISKVQGANTIAVAEGVHRAVDELARQLPRDVKLSVVRDASRSIRSSVSDVKQSLLEGAALTVLIVFLFLGSWRSTAITGLTLPIALIGTFLAMYALGYTLNIMTLMALSLSVGILIDDAIVVRENIVRHVKLGKDHRTASLEGTQEIGLAVLATTFTIVAVFVPVAFMGGIVGRFFFEFGITVSAAVLLSLFVSFTLDPMLSSVWPEPDAADPRAGGWRSRLLAVHERVLGAAQARYTELLRWALAHRRSVLALAALAFFGSFLLLPWIGTEFVPEVELGEVLVQVETLVGSSLEYTEAKLGQIDAALRELPEVASTYGTINTGMQLGLQSATVFVKLGAQRERGSDQRELLERFRTRLASIAGARFSLALPGGLSGGKPIQLSVQGPAPEELEKLSRTVVEHMRTTPDLVEVETSLEAARPALTIEVDRALASELGVDVQSVARALRVLVAGESAASWRAPDGENYDVTVQLPAEQRRSGADLAGIYLASRNAARDGAPRMVALRQVTRVVPGTSTSQIHRRSLSREVLISANVSGRPAGDVGRELAEWLAALELPPGYQVQLEGSTQDLDETVGYAGAALGLAVIFIYLILASQFGRFLQPLAIMVSLPLSLVGVFLGLLLAGSTLNIFSIIGFIMLMGLVTKNAILLVDFANTGVAAGIPPAEAVLEAGSVRLRPIAMTTAAMICGMLPLALGLGEGGAQRAPMAHAVIGGLITSTLLTLVVVPVIYTYLEELGSRVRGRQRRARTQSRSSGEHPGVWLEPSTAVFTPRGETK